MAKNFRNGFPLDHLVSAANVHRKGQESRSLARHIRNLLQDAARSRVKKQNVAPLIDNGGGTAGVQFADGDSGVLASSDLTGLTTGVTAASLNIAADTVMDAYAVLAERLNDAVFAALGAGTLSEGPGTIAASGTVAAIDDTASANSNDTDAATALTARQVQNDLLHAQRVLVLATDDARVAVGLVRRFPQSLGRWNKTGDLTFADDNPDTITRASGSFVDDGFLPGDTIKTTNSGLNNGTFTIASMTALILTLATADVLVAEVITAATEGKTFELVTTKRNFAGRLAGADAGPGLDEALGGVADPAGADWTLVFETLAAGITNAVNGTITASILLADWDLFVDQLSDNFALIADLIDEVTGATTDGALTSVQIPFFIPQTEYAAGTSIFVTSPISGRIRNIRSVVMDETTAGVGTFTLEINGSAITGASLVVATGAVRGDFDIDAVADSGVPDAANANFVAAGERIEIVGDATPTAGAIFGWIEVEETGETDDNLAGYAA